MFDILGPQADSQAKYQTAAQKARFETETLRGRGLFFAWYNLGTNLTHQTLSFLGAPILAESLYWRGLAKEALGDREGALADLTKAVEVNPTSTDALAELQRLRAGDP